MLSKSAITQMIGKEIPCTSPNWVSRKASTAFLYINENSLDGNTKNISFFCFLGGPHTTQLQFVPNETLEK